eukprot:TRINITY_DN36188_c0_g1_i1.p1 TRINITY_DN36188_c0_g1~~TRINITY_DN36188_c0_g1_i1.p1  ORF type:complete len:341 (+),score=23.61 TRINITY_DN36188_c0_g1_i1:269-1291(+)
MISTIANYLLKNKIIDGVVTVKFEYTQNGPIPKPFIATNISDIILSQGSKYLPVPLFEIIDDIINFDGKLAVIGTPCQIAGLRQLQKTNNNLKEKITFTISNFCGGYRDYKETERIFNIMRVDKGQITKFSYRGNGQPGTMSITQLNKPPIHLNYPEYSKLTGYIKYNRCRLCVDATGELADISFGDAWLDRFINSGTKWSFYICRSQKINKILQNIKQFEVAQFQDISLTELIESQKGNLTTKKERQNSRFILYKMLGKSIPSFDGGFNKEESNLLFELKVYINQKVMHLLEIIGLYLIIAKITKRVKKNNYGIQNTYFMPRICSNGEQRRRSYYTWGY